MYESCSSALALQKSQSKNSRGSQRYVADFSLALINRTGAYYVCRDLLANLPEFFAGTRYWRFWSRREPTGLVRRVMGKLMLFELARANLPSPVNCQSKKAGRPTLFMDPLYVLLAGVGRSDIVLCHDVGPVTHPTLFDPSTTNLYQKAYQSILKAKPGVVFVSEASRREFTRLFGREFRFLSVIPLYARKGIGSNADKTVLPVKTPFLLTTGALERRKNYERSIEAFYLSGLPEQGYSYVICGPRGNASAQVERIVKGRSAVHLFGYVDDAELRWLYRNASGFVLPSLLEGFGLPAIEAAQNGLLTLVSANTAQEEALGGHAVLIDPLSVTSIAEGMRQLVGMRVAHRVGLVEKARMRCQELDLSRFLQGWADLLSAPVIT